MHYTEKQYIIQVMNKYVWIVLAITVFGYLFFLGLQLVVVPMDTNGRATKITLKKVNNHNAIFAPQRANIELAPPADPSAGTSQY